MELRQLQYFCAVAQTEHLTHAAQQLHLAQSALSRQIQLLERELDIPLFVREGKGMRLSTFGQRFLPQAQRVLAEAQAAKSAATSFLNPEAGNIRFGFPHSLGGQYVPRLLRQFRTQFPAISFDLIQDRVQSLTDRVAQGDLELAVISPWSPDLRHDASLVGISLFEERFSIVLPADHPLATASEITLTALQNEDFVLFKPGYTLRDIVWQACIDAGFRPRIAFEAEETDTIRGFVRAGLGVSLLPQQAFSEAFEGIVHVRTQGQAIRRTIGFVWRNSDVLSAAALRFVEFARMNAGAFSTG